MELTPRLKTVYDMLSGGDVLVDVGCDHGYLPAAALIRGKYARAVASDINEGPLSSARQNIASLGLDDRCSFVLCDGLTGVAVPDGDYSVAVCGMGGDLIASILDASGEHKIRASSFVLQPMSKACRLRKYLFENGFGVSLERYVFEGERAYTVMKAAYTGADTEYAEPELYLGKREAREASASTLKKLERFHGKHRALRHSLSLSGHDSSFEDMLVRAAEEEIKYTREILK